MSNTTSMPENGNKSLWIPILAAALIIAFIVIFGSESHQYTQSLRDFQPREGAFYRLEGTTSDVQIEGPYRTAQLCSEHGCIGIAVSPDTPMTPDETVIVEGVWQSGRLKVSKLLRRCDGHPF